MLEEYVLLDPLVFPVAGRIHWRRGEPHRDHRGKREIDTSVVGDSSLQTGSTADAGSQSRRTLTTRSAAVSSEASNGR